MITQKLKFPLFKSLTVTRHTHEWAGKTILLRTDYNVPLSSNLKVTDSIRIKRTVATIQFLLKKKCKIVIASHLGRPKPQDLEGSSTSFSSSRLSLKPILAVLKSELKKEKINAKVEFCSTAIGPERNLKISQMEPESILLLENLRFYQGEKNNDLEFAKLLAQKCEIFVNDAFSVCHRTMASIVQVPKLLNSFAGRNLENEVLTWKTLLINPEKPFVMIIGGAKISDKISAVQNLTQVADAVLLGGGTANNFLKAEGIEVYNSYLEESNLGNLQSSKRLSKKKSVNYVKVAKHLLANTRSEKIVIDGFIPLPKIIIPSDVIAAKSLNSTKTQVVQLTSSEVVVSKPDLMYLDIGPQTIKLFKEVIAQAGTIFWNGPLGVFEKDSFSAGTKAIAKAIADSKAFSIIGGGDTLAAAKKFGLINKFDYASTAGGASLELLAGKVLPGLKPLYLD
jgi:phosphoglycerate kinase